MPKRSYSPGPPPKEALEYFRSKGWKVGFDHHDVWKEEHAAAFTVAKATSLDVLESIRGSMDRAIADGQTFRQFQKELTPTLQKLGWWGRKEVVDPKTGEKVAAQLGSPRRLKTIFRTNLRSAQAAGQWERIDRTKKALPYIRYRIGPSENHRAEHVAWDGLVLEATDSWWDTHFPPNGWGCKCWAQQLSKFAADKLGGPVKAPKIKTREWTNPRTGQTEKVPEGITPGFNFNPGKARHGQQLGRLTDRLNGVSPTAAEAVHRAWLQPKVFGQWRGRPQGNIPVAVMDPATQKRMGAAQKTILLSEDSMLKQDGKTARSKGHPELTNAEYGLLPKIVNKGEAFLQDGQRVIFFSDKGQRYRAVSKTTANGQENYLIQFQRVKEATYRKAKRDLERIR